MASILFASPRSREFSSAGTVLPGAKLYFYISGTTTPATVYQNAARTVAHSSPILADTGGLFPAIWLTASQSYDVTLKTSAGATVWSVVGYSEALTAAEVGLALYQQTAAESSAGITPTDYSYPPGDVRRYGAATSASASVNVTAIQSALDSNDTIELWENYPTNAALFMNDNNFIQGRGRNTGLTTSHAGAAIAGKSVTAASGTNVRRYSGGGRDFKITGPGRATGGGIALDMRGCTMFKWWGLLVTGIETGVYHGDGYSSYYNEYHGCDITAVVNGYVSSTLGNENKVFGGRVNDCTTGTKDDDNTGNTYNALAIEAFTTGHQNSATTVSTNTRYLCSRLENPPTSGTGFSIGATAQDTTIFAPQMAGLTTDISDSGLRTNITASEYLKVAGGTRIKKITRVVVTRDLASLATVSFRQEGPITVTGAAVGDAVTLTLPAAFPSGLMVGPCIVTAADTVYFPLYNFTGGPVDVASADYVFEITDYT